MSVWKAINSNNVSSEPIVVHRTYKLNQSSEGVKFVQFKSGSSTDFLENQSGAYWDANRVNFYLTGSQFDLEDTQSTDGRTLQYGHKAFTLGSFDSQNPQHLNKFHTTGSTLSISQYYWGDGIRRGSFKLTDNSHVSGTVVIVDDGYGNLYAPSASISASGDSAISSSDNYVGNIFYNLGIVNITETGSFGPSTTNADISYSNVGIGLNGGIGSGSFDINFDSTQHITTKEYVLRVKKSDFNYTNNLSARKFGPHPNTLSSQSLFDSPYLNDDILSSSLSGSWGPYMTTIGFYQTLPDGTKDTRPVMVARYPQPIRIRKDVDLIFKIRFDF